MNTLLLYACVLLTALTPSSAYEVSSFSTSSAPTFIRTDDGDDDLTYPVTSGDTFGSPKWYEQVERIGTVSAWKLVFGNTVVSNASGNGFGLDRYHSFTWEPERTYPDSSASPWCIEYDMNKEELYRDLSAYGRFDGMSTNYPGVYLIDSPYPDASRIPMNDISGPGTIECGFFYYNTDEELVRKSATFFPVYSDENGYTVDYAYENADPPVEIWLPKFQRLTPASRSALMAAYEAYFERMYYGSKGSLTDGSGDEDLSEWSFWDLGDPQEGPDFVIRSEKWSLQRPGGVGFLDDFAYPGSAYSDGIPSARRHYPSGCLRLMDEATNVNRLAYSMRFLSPFAVRSEWIGSGATPGDELTSETPFLVRPQWLLDGRTVPGHYTAANCGSSYLWWSSQVDPPPVPQPLDLYLGDDKYVPEFTYVFPQISATQFYSEDPQDGGVFPNRADRDLVKNIKAAQYAFTLNVLPLDDVFPSDEFEDFPIKKLFSMLEDAMLAVDGTGRGFVDSVSHMISYGAGHMKVLGFVTNCVRQAARSLPYRPDAMAAYSSRLAETSETFRVDSGPVAAASHLLGVMDRTIHIPFQEFVCTNELMIGRNHGDYAGTIIGVSNDVFEAVVSLKPVPGPGGGFIEPAVEFTGDATSFTVMLSNTNREAGSVTASGLKEVGSSMRMFARSPDDLNMDGRLFEFNVICENPPEKAFRVGDAVYWMENDPWHEPVDGKYVLTGPVRWAGEPLRSTTGPIVRLCGIEGTEYEGEAFVPTCFSDVPTRIVVSRMPANGIAAFREYEFCDADSVSFGMAFGPVQCGADSSGIRASHHVGSLLGGAVRSTGEDGKTFAYDFIQTSVKHEVENRADMSSEVDDATEDLRDTLSSQMTDVHVGGVRDPRDPASYAPVPDTMSQRVASKKISAEPVTIEYLAVNNPELSVTRHYPKSTADRYVFDVLTRTGTEGYVDYVCETGRTIATVYSIDEYWDLVDPYYNDLYLARAVTNVTLRWDSGGDPFTYKSGEKTDAIAVTTEVTRVVLRGESIPTESRKVVSNVTYTTSFDAEELLYSEFYVTEWREGWFASGDYYEYRRRRDVDQLFRPWPLPPVVRRDVVSRTEDVELIPSDAKSHEVITIEDGTYWYNVILTVNDGKVESISIEPDDSNPDAPTIGNVDSFSVASESYPTYITADLVAGIYEPGPVTNDSPVRLNWSGSFEGAARPAVMTWTDWTWNALKRD